MLDENGKADLGNYNPAFEDLLRTGLNESAINKKINELTLFNIWALEYHWKDYFWNPANCIQEFTLADPHDLYVLNNPVFEYQLKWIDFILSIVESSHAKKFVIIETDNELTSKGSAWRTEIIDYIKSKGDYIVSSIYDYCETFDIINGRNNIINRHKGGIRDPEIYREKIRSYNGVKPVVFNELYVGWKNDRATQRAVMEAISEEDGCFNVDHWIGYKVPLPETLTDAYDVFKNHV